MLVLFLSCPLCIIAEVCWHPGGPPWSISGHGPPWSISGHGTIAIITTVREKNLVLKVIGYPDIVPMFPAGVFGS